MTDCLPRPPASHHTCPAAPHRAYGYDENVMRPATCPGCGVTKLDKQQLKASQCTGNKTVPREFLEQHVTEARMSFREIQLYHGISGVTLSKRAK